MLLAIEVEVVVVVPQDITSASSATGVVGPVLCESGVELICELFSLVRSFSDTVAAIFTKLVKATRSRTAWESRWYAARLSSSAA